MFFLKTLKETKSLYIFVHPLYALSIKKTEKSHQEELSLIFS